MINELVIIVLEVSLIATFLAVFYFTYVKDIENRIVDTQISYLINDLTDISKYVLSDSQRSTIKEKLDNIQLPDLSEDDKKVIDNNKHLEDKTVFYMSIILCIGFTIFISYYLYRGKQNRSEEVFQDFVKAFIILICVGLTEYLFLNLIVKNYRSVKVNYIKYKFLENINNFSNKND